MSHVDDDTSPSDPLDLTRPIIDAEPITGQQRAIPAGDAPGATEATVRAPTKPQAWPASLRVAARREGAALRRSQLGALPDLHPLDPAVAPDLRAHRPRVRRERRVLVGELQQPGERPAQRHPGLRGAIVRTRRARSKTSASRRSNDINGALAPLARVPLRDADAATRPAVLTVGPVHRHARRATAFRRSAPASPSSPTTSRRST